MLNQIPTDFGIPAESQFQGFGIRLSVPDLNLFMPELGVLIREANTPNPENAPLGANIVQGVDILWD